MTPRSIIATALPFLTACSFASNASSSYAPRGLTVELAGRRGSLVYVSDRTNNLIDVFEGEKPIPRRENDSFAATKTRLIVLF